MGKTPSMGLGVCAVYCGSQCCCLMLGLCVYFGLLSSHIGAMGDIEVAIEGGTGLRVLVNAIVSGSSLCKPECDRLAHSHLPVADTHRCHRVSDKKAECSCDVRHFLI